jgi:serine/threonine-protein kinase
MKVDVDRLRFLAASLLEKNDIDWEAEHASAPDDVRSVLDHLEVIRQIAELHGTTTTSDQEQGTDPPEGFPPRWGHLRLLERIGHGTYGEVFRAWDENLDREVALKLLSQRNDDATADDALEEGKRLAKIQHANVVLVHGAERREGRVGIWMEFVRGRTLAAIVRDSGPFSAAEATLIGIDVCRAAAAVHAAGLLHCDIKARNIVRETGGRIVLLDLGAATPRTADTVSGAAGTPLYMAPEVLDGQPATTLSEIYCIGVVLFHLATGAYRDRRYGRSDPGSARRGVPEAGRSSARSPGRFCASR